MLSPEKSRPAVETCRCSQFNVSSFRNGFDLLVEIGVDQRALLAGLAFQASVRLVIALPANTDGHGNLAVRFKIADDYEPRDRVRGNFVTNYPDIAAFRVVIEQLMNREAEVAILSGQ